MKNDKSIVGTTVVKKSAYAIDKFLQNQVEIQNHNPQTELVIATDEIKFLGRLSDYIGQYGLRGEAIYYKTEIPDYAKDRRIWSMSAGREAIRKYVLERTDADWLFSVDADMTFELNAIGILKEKANIRSVIIGSNMCSSDCFMSWRKTNRWAAVQSGYLLRDVNAIGFGLGCTLLRRGVLEQVNFRCCEFKNGQVIEEGNMFEYDMIKKGVKIVKGLFLGIRHYYNNTDFVSTTPNKLPLSKRITTHSLLRYGLIGASILFKHDISRAIFDVIHRNSFAHASEEIEGVGRR